MLDVFAMLEGYCHLVTERSVLLRGQRECPDELREAVSSLAYAASRLGDLPELYHVRNVFSSMFGKDFTNSAVEIRNSCGVNPKIVQKLSTRQPSLESRVRITKEIATSKGITLDLVYDVSTNCPEHKPTMQVDPSSTPKRDSSGRGKYNYKDAASAALAAFESAEDAAAAAKAAVELSQASQSSFGDHPQSGSNCSPTKEDKIDSSKAMDNPVRDSTSELDKEDAVEYFSNVQLYPDEHNREINKNKSNTTSESDEEDAVEYFSSNVRLYSNEDKEFKKNKSNSTSKSEEENLKYFSHMRLYPDEHEDEKSFRSLKRSPYSSTGSPLHEELQEEDTFELALLNEKSQSETEKSSLRGWMFNAGLSLGSPDKHATTNLNPIYQKSNFVTKNRENLNSSMKLESEDKGLIGSAKWGRHSVSFSPETRSFHSEIGQEESADILPTKISRALSVRTRRGLQR